MVRLCLNGIVKNEAARIERMLDSIGPFINCVVMVDTGSTDDTKAKISSWCTDHKITCWLFDAPFENWSQARNAALARARQVWCETQAFDYLLLIDADMELKVNDPTVFDGLTDAAYSITQFAGTVHYENPRLLRADRYGQYLGVTHEYLDVPPVSLPVNKVLCIDHADGANRPEKFKRDIRLLKAGLRDEPDNARYMFYLANSYRDAGMPQKAADWYKRRVEAGGWDEEVWQAQYRYAACMRDLKRENDFVAETIKAINMRPSRAEAVYDLARYYRDNNQNGAAAFFAEQGLTIPPSKDVLFVNDFVYNAGLLEELSINGFYVEHMRTKGFAATDKLSLMKTPYVQARETARSNMFYYLKPLKEYCPSFTWHKVDWTPPFEGWTCMNPSIVRHAGRHLMNMRTVNYRMDEQGRYLIKDVYDDGTTGCNATAENPIHTRNWLLELHAPVTPCVMEVKRAREIMLPTPLPCDFPLVIGFEDMRLFSWKGELWSSSTVRQFAADGQCEQVRARISDWDIDDPCVEGYHRMLRAQRVTEKNWAPWPRAGDSKLAFMYQPGHVVDEVGQDVSVTDTGMYTVDLRGGSQLIQWGARYLAIVHEARCLPGSSKRFYWHRFVEYGHTGELMRVSRPFVMNDRVIEFVAGMCEYGSDKLAISYGYKDEEARIAFVDRGDVEAFLCASSNLRS